MFIALCTTGAAVMAQEFKGKIFNSETGEVVTGAEVQIFPGKQKAYSGLDGEFKFKNLSRDNTLILLHIILSKQFTVQLLLPRKRMRLKCLWELPV